jgi:phage FluMu protein Com
MSDTTFKKLPMRVDGGLEEERCPRCHALLFRADAEGQVEIKCRKCGYMVKRILSRVKMKNPITWSPTEGQGKCESPKRPIAERWGNDLAGCRKEPQ